MTWVKGHANDEHIRSGIITIRKKYGNDRTDLVADVGAGLHGKHLIKAAGRLLDRHQAYQRFMCKVAVHIVQAYAIHRELIGRHEVQLKVREAKEVKDKTYTSLQYPEAQHCRALVPTSGTGCYWQFLRSNPMGRQIENFISSLAIRAVQNDQRGITWLELYTPFRIQGYNKPLRDPSSPAPKRQRWRNKSLSLGGLPGR